MQQLRAKRARTPQTSQRSRRLRACTRFARTQHARARATSLRTCPAENRRAPPPRVETASPALRKEDRGDDVYARVSPGSARHADARPAKGPPTAARYDGARLAQCRILSRQSPAREVGGGLQRSAAEAVPQVLRTKHQRSAVSLRRLHALPPARWSLRRRSKKAHRPGGQDKNATALLTIGYFTTQTPQFLFGHHRKAALLLMVPVQVITHPLRLAT